MALSEEDVIAGMMAVIGTTSWPEAVRVLKDEGRDIGESTLRQWCKETRAVQYEQLREQWAGKIEAQLANSLLDNARLAAETERLAIEAAKTSLENKTAREPSKIARDLSQVKAQSVDKRLALQGRPTQITERRDLNEIVRALVGMKVAVIQDPAVVPDATLGPAEGVSQAVQAPQEALGAPEGPVPEPSRHLEAV
jgi:hypothetical protein